MGLSWPKVVKEAIAIDEKNGNIYHQDAIAKEMENVKVAFHILPISEKGSNGYLYANCNMMFDV